MAKTGNATKANRILKSMRSNIKFKEERNPIATGMYIPNLSGMGSNQDAVNWLSDNYLKLDCSNDPLTGQLDFTMGASDLTAIKIDGSTTELTSENGKPIDIDRTLTRTTASGSVSRQENLIDLDVVIKDDDTVTSGKANVITYYVFDERIKLEDCTISGDTNVTYSLFPQYASVEYNTGKSLIIDSSADISTVITGITSWMIPNITLNNAALDYTGLFYGVRGHCMIDITNTASNSQTTECIGVWGNAETDSGSLAIDVGYGGYFEANSNTLNYGVYAEGATAAVYAKGHIHFDADGTYSVGTATNKASAVYADDYYSADGSQGWTGSFTNGDADTVTVKDGLITDVS